MISYGLSLPQRNMIYILTPFNIGNAVMEFGDDKLDH